MKEQKIIWTVLPNGIDKPNTTEAGLKFSVFISPRLYLPDTAPTRLDEFPDFLDWPNKVHKMQFEVDFGNGEPKPKIKPDTDLFMPELWAALFKSDTYVRPYKFRDMKDRAIRTYPVSGISSYIKDKYVGIAENSPGSLPLLTPRIDDDGKPIGDPVATLESVIDDLGELLKPEKTIICSYEIQKNGNLIELLFSEDLDKYTKQIVDFLMPCIHAKGYDLEQEKAVVVREAEKLWIITDGNSRFYLENTGTSLVLFVYKSIYSKLDEELQIAKVLDPANQYGYSKEQLNFLQAKRFYGREEEDNPYLFKPNPVHMPKPVEKPKIDFHQMHSTLGDHPEIMRNLALVLDFIVPMPKEAFSQICIWPVWDVNDPPSTFNKEKTTTWTKCIVNNNTFIAEPKSGSNINERMLNLKGANDKHAGGNTVYDLIQIDPDGASLQMLNTAGSLSRQIKRKHLHTEIKSGTEHLIEDCMPKIEKLNSILEKSGQSVPIISEDSQITKIGSNNWIIKANDETLELELTDKGSMHIFRKMSVAYDTPDDAGLPSLRTAGIALTKSRRAYELHARLNDSFKLNKEVDNEVENILLFADELVRGYRVDILDEDTDSHRWRSLCEREGTYYFPGSGINNIQETGKEGYVKGASTSSKDAEDSDLYFHETVFRWNGWSLCAQRPGKSILTIPQEPKEVYLFNWDKIDHNNDEVINFLVKYYNARWTKSATLEKTVDNNYTIAGPKQSFKLEISGNKVSVIPKIGEVQEYFVKLEGSDRKVYTTVYYQDEVPGVVDNEAATEFKLESYFKARPESLPKLRFGHSYKLRARIVDLAGNSLKLEEPDGSFASDAVFYMRFEPLSPPTLVPRAPFTEGESLERMVIRSNFDQTEQEYVTSQIVVDSIIDKEMQYKEGNERHVVPPKTSQLMAETHGEFDEFIGQRKDFEAGYNLAKKEKGTLFDDFYIDINTGAKVSIPNPADIIIIPGRDGGEQGQYVIHKETQLILPYLPDPISRGVSFCGLPGLDSYQNNGLERIKDDALGLNLLKVPFNLTKLDSLPFRIRILERPGKMTENNCEESFFSDNPPQWQEDPPMLTIYIAKAEEANIRYSCYFNKEDLEKMGIWHWLSESLKKDELEKHALAGGHWMLTPYRNLSIVHAVQQPLCEPEINLLHSIKSKIGDTFSRIEGAICLNTASTDKIEMLAQWTEPIDDLAETKPDTLDYNASAFVLNIDRTDPDKIILPEKPCIDHRHEFGDTKYRKVKYYMLGTSRFREYFTPKLTEGDAINIDWKNVPGVDSEKLLKLLNKNRLSKFSPSGATIIKSSGENMISIEEGGASINLILNKENNALFLQDGSNEYVFAITVDGEGNLLINEDLITRRGPVYETDVFNSARPLSPKLQYAIPTFGWEEIWFPMNKEKKWTSLERKRVGGGLRLYLERPWFSSGDGELLGVVIYPHQITEESKLKPYVTQWGMDPIRRSVVPKGILRTSDFSGFEKSQNNLTLEEKGAAMKFDVVGYKPEYNLDRKLWFCDIQMKPSEVISYFPFIRLALAAYQPNSIPNAHLSRVVQTDFLQLANDRTLKIQLLNESEFKVSVSGYATGNRHSNRMEVTIESLPAGANKEFGWVKVKGHRLQQNPFTLPMIPLDAATHLWKWEANLKSPTTRGTGKYRIVVKEYEKFLADDKMNPLRSDVMITNHITKEVEVERLVYTDIVELP